MDWLANPRTPIWAAAAARFGVAVILFVAPQMFPMRDYYQPALEPSSSIIQRMLHRPRMFPLAEDELAYDELARSILRGDGYVLQRGWVITQPGEPTAYGGALYPLFIAAIYGATGNAFPAVVVVQILLSVAAVAGIARIGTAVGGDRAGLAAAWLGAVHPGLAMAPSLLMTEALSIPIIIGIVLAVIRWREMPTVYRASVAGGLVGLGFLVRSPLGLMGISAVIAVTWLRAAEHGPRGALRHIAAAALSAAIVMAPWTARNWVRYDRFLPADTKSGVNLWMYNRPPGVAGWADITGMNEGEVDAMYRERAWQNLREHPGWFARTTLARGARYWWPVPRNAGTLPHWAGLVAYAVITTSALIGMAILVGRLSGPHPAWLVLAPFSVGWGLMAITATGLRHRLTVEPLMVVGAAVGIVFVISAARKARADAPQGER